MSVSERASISDRISAWKPTLSTVSRVWAASASSKGSNRSDNSGSQMAETTRWVNTEIDVSDGAGYNKAQTPVYSGSQGKLGTVLEKMHRGEVLSQHEVSSALRDYNQMQVNMADLERRTKHMKLQAAPEDVVLRKPPNLEDPDIVVITKDKKNRLQEQLERKDKLIADLQKSFIGGRRHQNESEKNQRPFASNWQTFFLNEIFEASETKNYDLSVERLKNVSHASTSKSKVSVAVADIAPPNKIVDEFCDLYEKEWSHAFETLKASWKNEERAIYTLFRIVRHAYVFCYDISETQRNAVEDYSEQLQDAMLHPVFNHPIQKRKYKASALVGADTQKFTMAGRKLLGEYRNILVTQAVPGIQELFRKVKLPELFESEFVNKAVRDFVNRTVELIWLMVIQEPAMMVYWLEPKRTVLPDYFNFFKSKGTFVKQMVWPAVFLKEDGGILSKGVIQASMTTDDD